MGIRHQVLGVRRVKTQAPSAQRQKLAFKKCQAPDLFDFQCFPSAQRPIYGGFHA